MFSLPDTERIDLKLAVDARKMIAASVAQGSRGNSNVAQIFFAGDIYVEDCFNASYVPSSTVHIVFFGSGKKRKSSGSTTCQKLRP